MTKPPKLLNGAQASECSTPLPAQALLCWGTRGPPGLQPSLWGRGDAGSLGGDKEQGGRRRSRLQAVQEGSPGRHRTRRDAADPDGVETPGWDEPSSPRRPEPPEYTAPKATDCRMVEDGNPRGGQGSLQRWHCPGTGTWERGLDVAAGCWPWAQGHCCHRRVPAARAQARLSCVVPVQGTAPPSYLFFPGRIPPLPPTPPSLSNPAVL